MIGLKLWLCCNNCYLLCCFIFVQCSFKDIVTQLPGFKMCLDQFFLIFIFASQHAFPEQRRCFFFFWTTVMSAPELSSRYSTTTSYYHLAPGVTKKSKPNQNNHSKTKIRISLSATTEVRLTSTYLFGVHKQHMQEKFWKRVLWSTANR